MKKLDMEHEFSVTGKFDVKGNLKPVLEMFGTISGFKLPGGRVVSLVVALEVEEKNGKISYVTSEKEMDRLGFSNLHYKDLDFHPGEPIVNEDEVLF